MNVAVALLSALVVLPPMLVWADKRNWVSRGLIDKKPEPFIPTPPLGGRGARSKRRQSEADGCLARTVIVVHAPRWIRSPAESGTGVPGGMGVRSSFSVVPLADPQSTTA